MTLKVINYISSKLPAADAYASAASSLPSVDPPAENTADKKIESK